MSRALALAPMTMQVRFLLDTGLTPTFPEGTVLQSYTPDGDDWLPEPTVHLDDLVMPVAVNGRYIQQPGPAQVPPVAAMPNVEDESDSSIDT